MNRRDVLWSLAVSGMLSTVARAGEALGFSEFYITGTEPTEKLKSLNGKDVTISGFMAPPLKAESDFFVLTRTPMAVCPFCDSEMDWPSDIVLAKCDGLVEVTPFNRRIIVDGKLAIGFEKDAATGFVSFVRLMSAQHRMMTACEISNLQMRVSDGQGGTRLILDVPSLEMATSHLTAIVGASGSGKTTLLHCLTGIIRPSAGSIRMQGEALEALTEPACDAWRRTHVGLMFQDFQLLSEMTAMDNVLLPTYFGKSAMKTDRAITLMNTYGLTHHHVSVSRMSRGEQQRVAFARALLFNPPFIIADEPTASLDRDNAIGVIAAMKHCAVSGQTVIVATHDENMIAAADRVIKLADGCIVT